MISQRTFDFIQQQLNHTHCRNPQVAIPTELRHTQARTRQQQTTDQASIGGGGSPLSTSQSQEVRQQLFSSFSGDRLRVELYSFNLQTSMKPHLPLSCCSNRHKVSMNETQAYRELLVPDTHDNFFGGITVSAAGGRHFQALGQSVCESHQRVIPRC